MPQIRYKSKMPQPEALSEDQPIDPSFLKALMSTEFWQRDLWPRAKSALKGIPANALGAAVDVGTLMYDVRTWAKGGKRQIENVDIPLSSDWIGRKMGADTDSAAFIASGFASPDITDFNKVLVGASKAIVGGALALNKPARLQDAQRLFEKGMDAEEIYRRTNWLPDKDGGWKFWIDDRASKFNDDLIAKIESGRVVRPSFDENGMGTLTYKASDIMQHEELYRNYPALRDLPVRFHVRRNYEGSGLSIMAPDGRNAMAQFTPGRGDMPDMIDVFQAGSERENLHSLMLHEMQHWVQDFENFAKGGSPKTFDDLFEVSLIDDLLLAEADGRVIVGPDDIQELVTEITGSPPNKELLDNLDRMFFQIQHDETGESLGVYKSYAKTLVNHAAAMLDQLNLDGRSGKEILNMAQNGDLDKLGFVWYRRLAGEVEARTVQKALAEGLGPEDFKRKSWKALQDTPDNVQILK